jgi:hypothetical protein
MMRTFTNLAWPGDPYRASQQLYRRPPPMLAAFAAVPPGNEAACGAWAVAVAYLPLRRARAIEVTEQTIAFGFRAAAIEDRRCAGDLAAAADLDLMQARRHAVILAGHDLTTELRALRAAAPGWVTRGIAAVESGWAERGTHPRGMAAMIDTADGLDGDPCLAAVRQRARLDAPQPTPAPGTGPDEAGQAELMAAAAAERALTIALACARHASRYQWNATISTARLMAASAWDLFPHVTWRADGQGEQ